MNEITLRQLEYFVAVAEAGSITEAARRCNVSQAAVSASLNDLDRALGAPLTIRRRSKGAALTAQGRAASARARLVLEQVDGLVATARHAHGSMSGRLMVGVFRTLSPHVTPHLAEWFVTRHPAVQIDFQEGNGPDVQEAMLSGRVQVCVVHEAQLLPDCVGEELKVLRRQVVLSPDHPLADQPAVRLAELAEHPAALLDEEPALQRTLAEFRRHGVAPLVRWRSGSVPALQSIVGRGLAYSLLMQPTDRSPEGRPLIYRPIADETPTNSVLAATPRGVPHSTLVAEAIRSLQASWPGEPSRQPT